MDNKSIESIIFSPLIGEQLSSVCFVQDYLQIDFDGCKLTTYTTPVVTMPKLVSVEYSELNYKNELCKFIAKKVANVRYEEEKSVEIFFADYSNTIKIILDNNVDNLYYSDTGGKWFVI